MALFDHLSRDVVAKDIYRTSSISTDSASTY